MRPKLDYVLGTLRIKLEERYRCLQEKYRVIAYLREQQVVMRASFAQEIGVNARKYLASLYTFISRQQQRLALSAPNLLAHVEAVLRCAETLKTELTNMRRELCQIERARLTCSVSNAVELYKIAQDVYEAQKAFSYIYTDYLRIYSNVLLLECEKRYLTALSG